MGWQHTVSCPCGGQPEHSQIKVHHSGIFLTRHNARIRGWLCLGECCQALNIAPEAALGDTARMLKSTITLAKAKVTVELSTTSGCEELWGLKDEVDLGFVRLRLVLIRFCSYIAKRMPSCAYTANRKAPASSEFCDCRKKPYESRMYTHYHLE